MALTGALKGVFDRQQGLVSLVPDWIAHGLVLSGKSGERVAQATKEEFQR